MPTKERISIGSSRRPRRSDSTRGSKIQPESSVRGATEFWRGATEFWPGLYDSECPLDKLQWKPDHSQKQQIQSEPEPALSKQIQQQIDLLVEASATNQAFSILEGFLPDVKGVLKKMGAEFLGHTIREWKSIEDPTWTEYVLDLKINASTKKALAVWDDLNDAIRKYLDQTIQGDDKQLSKKTLSVSVAWSQ
ncbi:MAG: hypothetical protein HYU29_05670 [Chloroflexi bacterium]|nr:hypothetical protein [Chloroflexota bacterium]